MAIISPCSIHLCQQTLLAGSSTCLRVYLPWPPLMSGQALPPCPPLQAAHREEPGLHAHDVLAVPPRVLLAVPGAVGGAWRAYRRLLQLQPVRAGRHASLVAPAFRRAQRHHCRQQCWGCWLASSGWPLSATACGSSWAGLIPQLSVRVGPGPAGPCCACCAAQRVPKVCTHAAPTRRFKKAVEKGEIDEQEQKRQHARQSLERYMHYWQRWAENDASRKKVCDL